MKNIPEPIFKNFLDSLSLNIPEKLRRDKREFSLRLSNIGHPCVRKLWIEKNHPESKQEFTPDTYLKFSFGDLTEEYLIFLAELAGHTVLFRQQEIEIQGIKGHWDCIVDGVLLDVKSASSASFNKFKQGLTKETDGFGYLTQLSGYFHKAKDFPEVTNKTQAAFLVFDKQHGHICLDVHTFDTSHIPEFFEERKAIVAGDVMPDRAFSDEKSGESGNRELGFNCSYCDVKHKCWPGLRTFMYKKGPGYKPVHLTVVKREPNVPELKNEER